MDNSNMDGLIIIDRTQPGTMDPNEIIKMHSMELNWIDFENMRDALLY